MRPPFDKARLLLLQARSADDMERQEQTCFLERTRLAVNQLVAVNAAKHRIHPGLLDGMDGLLIGGAGEYSATKTYDWTESVYELVRHAADRAMPTFGSCWGHQIIAAAFGGSVIYDTLRAEIGCNEVELTAEGRNDLLFKDFPPRFKANMGHQDRVVTLPAGAVELARNESQPYQAFRLDSLPIYGTQFHSELDAERVRQRISKYRSFYERELGDAETFARILASLVDTTEVDHLLYDFIVRFVVDPASSRPSL